MEQKTKIQCENTRLDNLMWIVVKDVWGEENYLNINKGKKSSFVSRMDALPKCVFRNTLYKGR